MALAYTNSVHGFQSQSVYLHKVCLLADVIKQFQAFTSALDYTQRLIEEECQALGYPEG